MAKSPAAQLAKMMENLQATSGKSLDQWVAHSTFRSDASSQATARADLVAEMHSGEVDWELLGWLHLAWGKA